jgi:hypothetical protein
MGLPTLVDIITNMMMIPGDWLAPDHVQLKEYKRKSFFLTSMI